jgi:CysZ protein
MPSDLVRPGSPPLAKPPPDRALGVSGGLRAFVQGAGFIVGTPAVWLVASVPVVTAFVLTGVFGALGVWGAVHVADALVLPIGSPLEVAGGWVLRIVLGAIAILFGVLLAMTFAQPLSGWALDRLVRREEEALGVGPWPEPPSWGSMLRSLRVTLSSLIVSLPIFAVLTVVELAFPPAAVATVPLKFLLTALIVAYDFLDYPFSLRGLGVRARFSWIGRHWGAVVAFGACAALVLLIPLVGLFVLPIGVAGATRLVAETEGQTRRRIGN